MSTLGRLHAQARRSGMLQRWTLLIWTALAAGFVAPGLTKVLGADFAPGIAPASLMGACFGAFHAIGTHYGFVGLVQVAAGALLLSRRTALPGAVLYMPVIVNIFVLTTAVRFGVGTPVATGLMTAGCLWLLLWDGHRLAGVLSASFVPAPRRPAEPAVWDALAPRGAPATGRWAIRSAYVLGTGTLLAFTLAARVLAPPVAIRLAVPVVSAAALLTAAGWALSRWSPERERRGARDLRRGPHGHGRREG